mmetsp:Transcript_83988/g.122801  ORF Transcript_83988/g.122801 Transcript_83988/m.122801 type:complete len:81 (-) Transcript_83988:200-442(-)
MLKFAEMKRVGPHAWGTAVLVSTWALLATATAATSFAMPRLSPRASIGGSSILKLRGGADQYGMNDGFRNASPSPMAIKR